MTRIRCKRRSSEKLTFNWSLTRSFSTAGMRLTAEQLQVIGLMKQLRDLEISAAVPAAGVETWCLRQRLDGHPAVMQPQDLDALLSCSTQLTKLAWCGPQVRSKFAWEQVLDDDVSYTLPQPCLDGHPNVSTPADRISLLCCLNPLFNTVAKVLQQPVI